MSFCGLTARYSVWRLMTLYTVRHRANFNICI